MRSKTKSPSALGVRFDCRGPLVAALALGLWLAPAAARAQLDSPRDILEYRASHTLDKLFLAYKFEPPRIPEDALEADHEATIVVRAGEEVVSHQRLGFRLPPDAETLTVPAVDLDRLGDVLRAGAEDGQNVKVEIDLDGERIASYDYDEFLAYNARLDVDEELLFRPISEVETLDPDAARLDVDTELHLRPVSEVESLLTGEAETGAGCPGTCVEDYQSCRAGCRADPGCLADCGRTFDACMVPCLDADGDGVPNSDDNCVNRHNPRQADCDRDGRGDACDPENAIWVPAGPSGVPCFVDKDRRVASWYFVLELWGEDYVRDASACGQGSRWVQRRLDRARCFNVSAEDCCSQLFPTARQAGLCRHNKIDRDFCHRS